MGIIQQHVTFGLRVKKFKAPSFTHVQFGTQLWLMRHAVSKRDLLPYLVSVLTRQRQASHGVVGKFTPFSAQTTQRWTSGQDRHISSLCPKHGTQQVSVPYDNIQDSRMIRSGLTLTCVSRLRFVSTVRRLCNQRCRGGCASRIEDVA